MALGTSDIIALAGLIASVIAAVYAALAYHRPRQAPKPASPVFIGSLPEDNGKLADFLVRHGDKLVYLHLEIGVVGKYGKMFVTFDGDTKYERLELEVDEGAITKYSYRIFYAENEESCYGRANAIIFWKGTFIPRSFLSTHAGTVSGSLTQVDSIRKAMIPS